MNLANKYRPKNFKDMVGQEYIKEIISNQLKSNSLSSAYLFTGPAGTGKTSLARILANIIDSDVVEIDAASNNGVDNIRNIREKCRFRSMSAEKKLYIIDEVHMLSKGAFNAFLKILEEPPEYVIFILCTTEPDKILPTIISRCQRFDFRRIEKQKIVDRLRTIAQKENIFITDNGLNYIAHLAKGQMRNGISLLESLSYSYSEDTLRLEDIKNILGNIDELTLLELLEAMMKGDQKTIIEIIENLYNSGKNIKMLVDELIELVINIRKVVLFRNYEYVDFGVDVKEKLSNMKQLILDTDLDNYFTSLDKLKYKLKYEEHAKTLTLGSLLNISS